MSVTAYVNPQTGANATPAVNQQWGSPANGRVADGSYATNFFVTSEQPYFNRIQIIKGGVMQSANKVATPLGFYSGGQTSPYIFGGSADLWGTTWLGSDFNDPNFGIAIGLGADGGKGGTSSPADPISGLLVLSNFSGLGLSDAVVITGIEISVVAGTYSSGGGTQTTYVDGVQLRVYYTFTPKVTGVGDSAGVVYSQNMNKQIPDKRFDYNVSTSTKQFLGKLPEPGSDPTFKLDKNNLLSTMQLTLPTNDVKNDGVDIGDGEIIEPNNEVEIIAYYGDYDAMIDETGHPMVDEDFNLVIGSNGAPEGDTIFTGYMSRWDLDTGVSDNIITNLITHSNELFQLPLETDDTAAVVNSVTDGGYYGIAGGGPTDNISVAQVISVVTTNSYNKLTFRLRRNFTDTSVSMSLYYGTPGALGAGITSVIGVPIDERGTDGFQTFAFVFGEPVVFSAGQITAYFDVSDAKTGGNETYPIDFKTGNSYAGGKAYVYNNSTGSFVQQSNSLLFTLWITGGVTEVTYTDMDPADIMKSMVDFATARGSRIRYSVDSITPTATLVTATFKGLTVGEAIQNIPSISPADWFVRFDPGDNIVYLSQRPGVPDHIAVEGQNVSSMKLSRSIEQLVNQALFSGGGTPALYLKVTDTVARRRWRPGLGKISNNQVVDKPTGILITQSYIDRNKEPLYYGTLTLFSKGYFIEDVNVGELLAFMNYGPLIDQLLLQAASTTYFPDHVDIDLDNLPPKTQQLVDDITRQLKNDAASNNPASPS